MGNIDIENSKNSFSGDFGWTPSILNILYPKEWYYSVKKAIREASPLSLSITVNISINTIYNIMALIGIHTQSMILPITGTIAVTLELIAHLGILFTLLYLRFKVNQLDSSDVNHQLQSIDTLFNRTKSITEKTYVLPKIEKCFHPSFFSSLPIKINNVREKNDPLPDLKDFIRENIKQTTRVLLMGMFNLTLTFVLLLTPLGQLTMYGYVSLLILSFITYYLRYSACSSYLRLDTKKN